MSILYTDLPANAITMNMLIEATNVARETLRCKIRTAKIRPIGKLKYGQYKTTVYNLTDVEFLLTFDFSTYKQRGKSDVYLTNDYPFCNSMVRQFIRGGL